ncbi:MAG: glycosyltransferase family 87 protein [Terracidiphilus sp.]
MKKGRLDGLILVLLGMIVFLVVGIAWRHVSLIEMGDFKVVYYPARCLLQHGDPYSERDVLRVYQGEDRERPNEPILDRQVKTRFFYPPTALIVTLPFAFVGFAAGKLLWTVFLTLSLVLASILACDMAGDLAPLLSGFLAGFALMNSFWLFMVGNAAAIAVGLCVIAVWCFYRGRLVVLGVLCLALSLALKPNDSGLVWLCLLLVGGAFRKRALQALFTVVILSLPVVLWVTYVSSHWLQELQANMAFFSGVGSIVDPAATGMTGRNMDSLVQLQSVAGIFFTNPSTYNLIAYAIGIVLILIWVVLTARTRPTPIGVSLALAAAAPLSMLPTYHMQHDAKLILLTIPACAMLWARRGALGWLAMLVTAAGFVVNGDIFSGIRILLTRGILVPQPTFASRLITVVFTRPAPLVLLLMAVFYLWVLAKHSLLDQENRGFEALPEQVTVSNRIRSSPFSTMKIKANPQAKLVMWQGD